jgi:hypothetical protein
MAKTTSNKLQEILKTATTREKAIIICHNTEGRAIRKKDLLTKEEEDAIRESVPQAERRELNRYLNYYNTYLDMNPLLGLCEAMYKGEANEIVGHLRELEAYIEEENHLNTIYEKLRNNGNDEALIAFDEALSLLNFSNAVLKRDKLGYIKIDVFPYLLEIVERSKYLCEALIALKSIVVAIEEWTKAHRSKAFMPATMVRSLEFAKKYDYASDIAPKYSKKLLKERRDRGEKISAPEARWAIFPYYDEVEPRQDYLDLWRKRLADIEKSW